MNPIKKTIGWADYSWNPVVGCKRNCFYCYAHRKFKRFHKKAWPRNEGKFENITLYPRRFADKDLFKPGPYRIFVGDMSDFQYYLPGWIKLIFHTCIKYRQHTFMFLTKDITAYKGYYFPDNTMQGVTFVRINSGREYSDVSRMRKLARPFISLEPLMGPVCYDIPEEIEQVMVGAMSGTGALAPNPEWIRSVRDHCPEKKIFWKKNMQPFLKILTI